MRCLAKRFRTGNAKSKYPGSTILRLSALSAGPLKSRWFLLDLTQRNRIKETGMNYPLLEQDGHCASISVEVTHGGRWRSFVTLERASDFARLKTHSKSINVPNSYPSDSAVAEAAYSYARMLIKRETMH